MVLNANSQDQSGYLKVVETFNLKPQMSTTVKRYRFNEYLCRVDGAANAVQIKVQPDGQKPISLTNVGR